MKPKLITQEKLFNRAYNGMRVTLALPFRFANGYFVEGKYPGDNVVYYATVKPENKDKLHSLLKQEDK